MKNSGIYAILNRKTGRVYIGGSLNLKQRFRAHKLDLKRGVHYNHKLQKEYGKFNEENFEFQILEFVSDCSSLIRREQYWIDNYRQRRKAYNLCPIAGSSLGLNIPRMQS